MVISITKENKNNLSITNEGLGTVDLSIADAIGTIDDAAGTIDNPRMSLLREDKNNLSISNENKL
jgi:hypothetical protein